MISVVVSPRWAVGATVEHTARVDGVGEVYLLDRRIPATGQRLQLIAAAALTVSMYVEERDYLCRLIDAEITPGAALRQLAQKMDIEDRDSLLEVAAELQSSGEEPPLPGQTVEIYDEEKREWRRGVLMRIEEGRADVRVPDGFARYRLVYGIWRRVPRCLSRT